MLLALRRSKMIAAPGGDAGPTEGSACMNTPHSGARRLKRVETSLLASTDAVAARTPRVGSPLIKSGS